MRPNNTLQILASIALVTAATTTFAGTMPIDYNTGFTAPITVDTASLPGYSAFSSASSADGTVTFSNPNMYHNGNSPTDVENYDPFTGGFGGDVTLGLPVFADAFGLDVAANGPGTFTINFDLYSNSNNVGTGTFSIPSGAPSGYVEAAFSSDVSFNSVVLTAPADGYMRILDNSIKYQAAPAAVPDTMETGYALAVAFVVMLLGAAARKSRQFVLS